MNSKKDVLFTIALSVATSATTVFILEMVIK